MWGVGGATRLYFSNREEEQLRQFREGGREGGAPPTADPDGLEKSPKRAPGPTVIRFYGAQATARLGPGWKQFAAGSAQCLPAAARPADNK